MTTRRPIIVGNWKMHKTIREAVDTASEIRNILGSLGTELEVGIAPPFTALSAVAKKIEGSKLLLAAQTSFYEDTGAYTGEISPIMLADAGCQYVIVGHSERRQYFGEDDACVSRKVQCLFRHQLMPILCVGEHLTERESGKTFDVVTRQITAGMSGLTAVQAASVVVAYEPVWAIGTGRVATATQAQEVHLHLRQVLAKQFGDAVSSSIRIQYGGSVKPDNIAGLLAEPDIDGALVGGASLDAQSFIQLLKHARKQPS